jgi:hypothetical protein
LINSYITYKQGIFYDYSQCITRTYKMKASQFLFEAGLQNSELRKHGGKYIAILIKKIENGEPLEVIPAQEEVLGKTVTIVPSEATKVAQAYYGLDSVPTTDTLKLADNGDLIPEDPALVRALRLETDSGETVTTSLLQKTAEFKGGKNYNAGDVAEAALGAAVTALFGKRGAEITESDVLKVIKALGEGKLVGKNNKFGKMKFTADNDTIEYILGLNKASYNAIYLAANGGDMPNDILGALRSAVSYANTNTGIAEAVKYAVDDKGANAVVINADGVSDQKGVKADLFLTLDGTTLNLISLKAGDVKQFGQVSGYNFPQIEKFFGETFGVSVSPKLADNFVDGDAKASFEAIREVYKEVANKVSSELKGDNDKVEAKFVERLYKGIEHHATRGEKGTSLVILKTTPNAAGYSELQFGQVLADAMETVDLDAELVSTGVGKPAKIQVYGTTQSGKRSLLLQVRSNYKSEGKGYVRNIVEMGPLLKLLAQIQKQA